MRLRKQICRGESGADGCSTFLVAVAALGITPESRVGKGGGGLLGSERRIKRPLAKDRKDIPSVWSAYQGMKVQVHMLHDYS